MNAIAPPAIRRGRRATTTCILALLLAAIATVSLLVGSTGIMNVCWSQP